MPADTRTESHYSVNNTCNSKDSSRKSKNDVTSGRTSKKALTFWYTNADTLNSDKVSELKSLISSGDAPDLIAICEYKPKNYVRYLTPLDYEIDGYIFEHEHLSDKGPYRGVAIYVHKSVKYRRVEKTMVSGENEKSPKEAVIICIQLMNGEKVLFSVLYRSPNSTPEENRSINDYFRQISKLENYKHKIILGDFNRRKIDWTNETSNDTDDEHFLEAVRDGYFTQHVMEETRARGTNQPSILDLIFTSNENSLDAVQIEAPLGKSDHAMIKTSYQSIPDEHPDKLLPDYRKADFEKMKGLLSIDWESYLNDSAGNVNALWDKFMTKFKEAESVCIPKKIVKAGQRKFGHALDKKKPIVREK